MKTRDRMGDPFYANLMFQIEQIICGSDGLAKEKGIVLTDSQVRSALIKTSKKLEGADPDVPQANERDKALAGLIGNLCRAWEGLGLLEISIDGAKHEKSVDVVAWIKAIEAVEDSLQIRKSPVPGSRCYLDYVQRFIADALDAGR